MNRRVLVIVGLIGALVAALVVALLFMVEDPVEQQFRRLSDNPPPVRSVDEEVLSEIIYSQGEEGAVYREGELSFEQIVALLRQRYGDRIHNARVRVAMLEELMRYLREQYPDRWVEVLNEILAAAFPERATELFRLSENLYRYEREIEERRDLLGRMSREERQELLWSVRYEYFGEQADEIWESEKRMRGVAQTLEAIKTSELSVQEKLSAYTRSLEDSFGDQLPSVLEKRKLNLVNAFTEAVQEDLADLEPEDRNLALRQIRSALGMDEAALERWDDLDRRRDARWTAGETYMERRKEVQSSCTGDCEAELQALRRELFGEEADIIAREEAGGFFRFERERRYGRE